METKAQTQEQRASRILIPVRYSAWLSGELGQQMAAQMEGHFSDLGITRMPRGFLVEGETALGTLVERVVEATAAVEEHVAQTYPVFHRETGPVWAGVMNVVLPKVDA